MQRQEDGVLFNLFEMKNKCLGEQVGRGVDQRDASVETN